MKRSRIAILTVDIVFLLTICLPGACWAQWLKPYFSPADLVPMANTRAGAGWFLQTIEVDSDNDGVIDRTHTFAYDTANRIVHETAPNEAIAFTYDDDGNVIQVEADHGNNGTIDAVSKVNWDSAGNLTDWAEDTDNDGEADECWDVIMDIDNDRPDQLAFYGDCQTEDDPGGIAVLVYDAQTGDLAAVNYDHDNDGSVDSTRAFTYHDDGNLQQIADDDDNDGTVDQTDTFVFDENGNLERIEQDAANDGIIDYVAAYTWNDAPLSAEDSESGDDPEDSDTGGNNTGTEGEQEDDTGGGGCFLQSLL